MSDANLPVPADPAAISAEIADIRASTVANPATYEDKRVQARHLALLEAEIASRKTAAAAGSVEASTAAVAAVEAAALQALPELDREVFTTGLQSLSENVRAVVSAELGWGIPQVSPVGPEQVALFATTPEGKMLVREWGVAAPRNIAIIAERMLRALSLLPEYEADALSAWFDALPPSHAAAVHRALVHGA